MKHPHSSSLPDTTNRTSGTIRAASATIGAASAAIGAASAAIGAASAAIGAASAAIRSAAASRAWRRLFIPLVLALLVGACSEDDGPITPPVTPGIAELEARVHLLINQYRADKGLIPLTLSDVITAQARQHSRNMADGSVPFSHDGFQGRVDAIKSQINIGAAGENVAMNSGYSDPARTAVDGWIKSDGHRANIEGDYDLTGIGIAQSPSGGYYLTQIFAKSR